MSTTTITTGDLRRALASEFDLIRAGMDICDPNGSRANALVALANAITASIAAEGALPTHPYPIGKFPLVTARMASTEG